MSHPIIRRYYDLYNDRRFQEAADLFAPDAVIEHCSFANGPRRGGSAYIESADSSIRAFPDAHIDVLSVESHGETIYEVELMATGTHMGMLDLGTYGRFQATSNHIRVRHREVLDIRDGKIASASVTLDVTGLLAQLRTRPGV